MRAGEAARQAGVNVETLRYYERRGLLPEPILGHGRARLIETGAGEPLRTAPGDIRAWPSLRLTHAGERVLERKADRVTLLGIDRWVGGTHLSAGHVWRWDPAERRLIAPA